MFPQTEVTLNQCSNASMARGRNICHVARAETLQKKLLERSIRLILVNQIHVGYGDIWWLPTFPTPFLEDRGAEQGLPPRRYAQHGKGDVLHWGPSRVALYNRTPKHRSVSNSNEDLATGVDQDFCSLSIVTWWLATVIFFPVAFDVSLGGVPFSFKETDDAKGIRFSWCSFDPTPKRTPSAIVAFLQ